MSKKKTNQRSKQKKLQQKKAKRSKKQDVAKKERQLIAEKKTAYIKEVKRKQRAERIMSKEEREQMKKLLASEGITTSTPGRRKNPAELFKRHMNVIAQEEPKLVHNNEESEVREEVVPTQVDSEE